MKKSCLVLALLLCCTLILGIAGCTDQTTTTTTSGATGTTGASNISPTAAADGRWTELDPAGDVPSSSSYAQMVCDSHSGQVILCGDKGVGTSLTNIWVYDLSTNIWTDLGRGGDAPSKRWEQALVYDSRSEKVILFGGGFLEGSLNDTWAYDPAANTWTQLEPAGDLPAARSGHSMVYDSSSGRVLLFGGHDDNTVLGDAWAYDPSANTWTELDPTGDGPSGRYGHSMVYDSRSERVILFGGSPSRGPGNLNDTWAYDPAADAWTELSPDGDLPLARSGHAMVYEAVSGSVILFGGQGASTVCFDTWAYGMKP